MRDCCVAHLVRKQNGVEVFRRYLASYRENPAGVDHDHVIIFKGFGGRTDLVDYERELQGTTYRTCFVDDTGLDIGSYMKVLREHHYSYYCFTNSYSRVLHSGWLYKLRSAIAPASVGLVGSSASCGSIASYTQFQAGLPSAYDGYILDDPYALPKAEPSRVYRPTLRFRAGALRRRWAVRLGLRDPERDRPVLEQFDPFPVYHIRSNSFMVRGDVLARLPRPKIRDKSDAFRFESGKKSLTNRVYEMGLAVVVVGQDGRTYEKDRWHESNTFWQRDQGNLLVADNQSDKYAEGSDRIRTFCSRFAWREFADPVLRESKAEAFSPTR